MVRPPVGKGGLTEADSELDDAWVVFPVGLFADSLGIWSRKPIRRVEDLAGLRLMADPLRFGFLSQLGVQFVQLGSTPLSAAVASQEIDLVLSAGAAQDDREGLFHGQWFCYSPGLRHVVGTAWLGVARSDMLAHRESAMLPTRLAGVASWATLRTHALAHAANGGALTNAMANGFRLLALPGAIVQEIYNAYSAWSEQNALPGNDEAALRRNHASRLTRLNLARYYQHVA